MPFRSTPRVRPRWGRAVAAVAVVATSAGVAACATKESPPQLDRIDGPAQVDEERLGGVPGAVNDDEERG